MKKKSKNLLILEIVTQGTLVCPDLVTFLMSDMFCSPSVAERGQVDVVAGDIILVATDGLFDNMTDSMILRHLEIVKVGRLLFYLLSCIDVNI